MASVYCDASRAHWTNLRNRRLQNHGGTPHAGGMVPKPLPPFLDAVGQALVQAGVFDVATPPNHVLLNECVLGFSRLACAVCVRWGRHRGSHAEVPSPASLTPIQVLVGAGYYATPGWSSVPPDGRDTLYGFPVDA